MGKDRPEHTAPPEVFYDETEARKYTENSRMVAIQAALTERALELLALPNDGEPKLLLDIGCGSGLSGEALTEAGHAWVVRLSSSGHLASSGAACLLGWCAWAPCGAVAVSTGSSTAYRPSQTTAHPLPTHPPVLPCLGAGPGHQPCHAGGGPGARGGGRPAAARYGPRPAAAAQHL